MTFARRTAAALAALLALFLLTACMDDELHRSEIAPALPVVSRQAVMDTYNASSVKVAVGQDGSHHMVYLEEEERGFHRMVYAYQKSTEAPRLMVIPYESGAYDHLNPDIAVASSGRVFITYQLMDTNLRRLHNCYTSFMPDALTPPACTNLDVGAPGGPGISFETEPPILVAENNNVYAVFSVYSSDGEPRHQLKALRLSPSVGSLLFLHDVVHGDSLLSYHRPAGAIEDSGILHVVFSLTLEADGFFPESDVAYYARVSSGGGDVKHLATLMPGYRYEEPAIVIKHVGQAPDQVYYLLAVNPRIPDGTDTLFHAYAHASDVMAIPASFLPLPESANLIVRGTPALILWEGSPYAFFAASPGSGPVNIYSSRVDVNQGVVTIAWNTPFNDCPPRAVLAEQPNPQNPPVPFTSPVAAWRECNGFTYRDMYVYDQAHSDADLWFRRAMDGSDDNNQGDYDLAVSGDSVFAAWIDERSASDPRLVPWISSNVYRVNLPAVISN